LAMDQKLDVAKYVRDLGIAARAAARELARADTAAKNRRCSRWPPRSARRRKRSSTPTRRRARRTPKAATRRSSTA
jgi:hypothetical protein